MKSFNEFLNENKKSFTVKRTNGGMMVDVTARGVDIFLLENNNKVIVSLSKDESKEFANFLLANA